MKKLYAGLLSLGATACQPHSASTTTSPVAAKAAATSPTAATVADTTAAVLQLLRQVDLIPAWYHDPEQSAMEGFYGPNNYRISFYYDTIWHDAQRPNLFHFAGRDRYKKVITPFTGTLTVTRLAPLPDTVGVMSGQGNRAYTAFANFVLREDAAAKEAGWCQGRAVLDFQVTSHGQATQAISQSIDTGAENPTMGCGLLFWGTWQDNRTGRQQPVTWANYYGVIVPETLRKLGLGDRADEVRPELAKYGCNTIMENDEWWADTPKPSLNM